MNEIITYIESKLRNEIYLLNCGVRPCFHITFSKSLFSNDKIKKVLKEATNSGIRFIIKNIDEFYDDLYCYKYSHIGHVISFMCGMVHDHSIVQHWINGKMFGYSEEAIKNYLETKGDKE